ncbi:Ribosomal protein L25 [Candidatus Omnitrophus magneticus]|uniref:Large ribosomal subunit protein bL25 n=1 Tax=Candidatus Omnitrophus magneticus TaxID=1609969 RepID=A0A0F0CKA9_9BACT|nr:Ribosomal protein L25 [Candidatus Omnitrophus magneticus]
MKEITIKTIERKEKGKNQCKHLRAKGFVPGIVYKGGKKGLSVSVDSKEIWHAMHTEAGGNAIITLDIVDTASKKLKKTVIIQETQMDPLNDKLIHVDFVEISLTEKIKVKVPIAMKGEAPGVKEESGVLHAIMWEIEVECLPKNIPQHIDIDVSSLRVGDTIHLKDIKLPEGVAFVGDLDQLVLNISAPVEEEGAATLEGAEGVAEPELIKKGKKEEEGGEETASGE